MARLIIFLVLFSCQKTAVKTYNNDDCNIYVAGKKGFWIDIYSKEIKASDITFSVKDKKVIPETKEVGIGNNNFFIKENLKLIDTISLECRGKIYKIYDFENLRENAINGSNHKSIEICRVSTAKINGKTIPDSRNNILKVYLE